MRLEVSGEGFTQDLTEYAGEISWAGGYRQCARTLAFTLASSADDPYLQVLKCDLGNQVRFYVEEQLLFDGYVFRREKATESHTLNITCLDRGIYLRRNEAVYKFVKETAGAITRQVCRDYGIKVGELAEPGVSVSRNFLGSTLYEIIQTAYTLSAHQTGKQYMISFTGDVLTVTEEADKTSLVITGGSNLMGAAISESVENMVNQVNIYDHQDHLIRTVQKEDNIALYGLMQQYLRQREGEDAGNEALKILEDNGVSNRITVEILGNTGCVTGQAVMMQEPYTGLLGLFYIEDDVHTWKLGQYYSRLTLSFRRMMDAVEAGSEG